jgi:hypothetical protein
MCIGAAASIWALLCCVVSLLVVAWSAEIPVGVINLLSSFLSCGFCYLLVEGLLTCPVLIPMLYNCSVEGFSAGGITVLLLSMWFYCCFSVGLYIWQNCPTVHIDKDQTLEV